MKATELIAKLQALVDEFDDYDIVLSDGNHYAAVDYAYYMYEDEADELPPLLEDPVFVIEPKRGTKVRWS